MSEELPEPQDAAAQETAALADLDALAVPDPLAERAGIEAARACLGGKLDELGGAAVGRVEAVLVDARDGSPTWLVIRLSRFGRRAAVPFDLVAVGVGHAWVPYPKETIRAAELDPAGGLSCAEERALAARFELPEGSGRLGALAGRAEDEPGSVPA